MRLLHRSSIYKFGVILPPSLSRIFKNLFTFLFIFVLSPPLDYLDPLRIHWALSSYLYWWLLLHYVDFIVLTIDSEMSMYFLLSNPLDRELCSFITFTANITYALKIKKNSIFPKWADILWTVQKGNWLRWW